MSDRLVPKIVDVFREGYSSDRLFKDVVAGILVGIVALPMAIAFAIASGVRPEAGLYTAVVAGFLISVFSGSRVQIGGPTGAFIVLIADVVHRYGVDGLAIATLMAGGLLLTLGLARMGAIIKFIPYPVTVGFTSGIALIIFSSQVRDLLGMQLDEVPSEFIDKWAEYAHHFNSIQPAAVLISGVALAIILFWPRVTHTIPGPLVALLATTGMVHLFGLEVETIGSRFGEIPRTLPMPRLPTIEWAKVHELISPALSIALLAGIESLLSAVVADGMTGRRHRSNMELVAQGIANIASPLFGGIPATGAIARTATNIKNGATSPVAGIVHAFTLLLIMMFFGNLAGHIPLATLAAILIVVAYNMSEWRLFLRMFRGPRSDVAVMMSTFGLTVLFDLIIAIQVGVVLAALLFMHRMASVTQAGYIRKSLEGEEETDDPDSIRLKDVPDGVEVFEIYGPFFFGATEKFKDALSQIESPPKVLVLRLRHVLALDATALRALEDVFQKARHDGTTVVLSGVRSQPHQAMERSGLLTMIGDENVFGNIDRALQRAREIVKPAA